MGVGVGDDFGVSGGQVVLVRHICSAAEEQAFKQLMS
ncbi:MAG: hypothetical protein UX27_C0026G0006 [Candidatus Azambacteria bacterium GW2011_GWA2_45_90]|uniref:Uncharacterized protein n=1 Tax=Candidatus Azambacteria bacterium GW2011_GWA2_45_90 TaxID=1618614 RepID=A0A0G1RA31_9BACT|nr:MAG: hypothetical protein UX27_C0026G0006 [Candidatus Azambacteria bacterium GW2011_GWA2_45_90]